MLTTSTPAGRKIALFLISISLSLVALAALTLRQHVAAKVASGPSLIPAVGPLTLLVNTLADAGDINVGDGLCDTDAGTAGEQCSLRAAIQETNAATTGTDIINFILPPNSIITLNNALPDINGNLTINGHGPNTLTVMRNTLAGTPEFTIFTIPQFATASISGLTISNGRIAGNQPGGGVSNRGTLTMTDCNVYGNNLNPVNFDAGGGGLFNAGSMTLNNCNIGGTAPGQGNGSNGSAAGISEFGTLTMTGGSIVGNSGTGMKVTSSLGGTTLINVNISNNTGIGVSVGGALTLINCLISNNSVPEFGGGGINVEGGVLNAINTTISGNTTGQGGGGIRQANNGVTHLVNVTITNNRSDSNNNGGEPGGGIDNSFGTVTLTNTIVAGNFHGGSPSTTADDINGVVDSSSSFDLIGVGGSGGLTHGVNNNQVGVADPKLAPLTDNGGLTMTHALLSDSPAIDAGSNANASNAGLTTDQRGFARFIDGPDADTTATVDVGASEAQLPFSEIGDTSTNEDIVAIVAFDVGDPSSITSITATSSNTTLIPNNPANISARISSSTGSVTMTPAANLFGMSDITVTINRTGGSTSRTFKLTVNSSNDAPSFVKGADQTVNEDSSSQTLNSWATAISPGPSDESGQSLSFIVTNNNNALFSSQPSISWIGTLTYTPAPDAAGSAAVSVSLKDDGDTANGGKDTSTVQTFTITLTQVNDAPSFIKGPDQTVINNAGSQGVNNWATNISVGPSNETGSQGFFFVITGNTNPGLFTQAPSINASGRLAYRPASNAGGTATITTVLRDTGGTANGGVDMSAPQTFNITVIPGRTKTGVFRPSTGELFLKNSNSSGFADTLIVFGNPGDYPLAGDWNGDGTDSVGIYRNGVFYLRNSNTTGFADIVVPFGNSGDQPIAGDWNGDGLATIGIYRNGTFYLRNSNTAGPPDLVFTLGDPGDVGIAGDWNGDGIVTCGVFRPSNGIVYLKNSNTTGFADLSFVFGNAGDKPVAGDWNADGIDTVGIYRGGLFYLTNSNTTGFADTVFVLGNNGDFPIAGNWNGSP